MLLVVTLIMIALLNSAKPEAEKPLIYCGRTLANVRMLLCYKNKQKRSTDNMIEIDSYTEEGRKIWPWMSSQGAESRPLLHAARVKRNTDLINECCYRPCYTSELLSFC
nr:insulin-like peptide [Antheraea pernyi]